MKVPKVSILLPTYRRPQLIKRALSSVYGQDFKDWELIVVENGSTPEIQKQYFQEVVSNLPEEYEITWLTVPWASLPDALNLGLERATGKYIAIQEDDDEWMTRFLSVLTSHMDDCTCGMAYVRQIEIEKGRPTRRFTAMPDHFDRDQLLVGNYISLPTAMVRREVLEAINGFHPDAGPATDWITWCLIAKDWKACYLDEALLMHHWHEDPNAPNYCLVEPGNTPSSIRHTLLQRKMLARGDFGPWPTEQRKKA